MSILHNFKTSKPLFVRWIPVLFMMTFLALPGEVSSQISRYVDSAIGADAGDCSVPGTPCATISYALGQAAAGDDIYVEAGSGTYNENVLINKSVNLYGNGATVQGSASNLGTFQLLPNVNNVTIDGFTLLGYDNPNPAVEFAALYFQGNHSNITVTNNTITADGEGGLLTEYNTTIANLTISNNVFNGKTYVGAAPGGNCISDNQYSTPNFPRQLVVISPNATNIVFTDNLIEGQTGDLGSGLCSTLGKSNFAVTIDATNATISGNTFKTKIVGGNSALLRTRGSGFDINDNTFDSENLSGTAYYHFYNATALNGGDPSDIAGLFASNTYLPSPSYSTSSGNTLIFMCTGPVLTAEINAVILSSNPNDGISEVFDSLHCGIDVDLNFGDFTHTGGIGLESQRKVFQSWEGENVTVGLCTDCNRTAASMSNTIETVALVDPSLPGKITIKFLAYIDANNNDQIDLNECSSDTIIYIYTLHPPITNVQIVAVPDGDVCLGATNVQYSVNVEGGVASELQYYWTAYNSGDGSGTGYDGFLPSRYDESPTRSWTASTGAKSVGVSVWFDSCPNIGEDLYSFEVAADPVAPTLVSVSNTDDEVCEGTELSATIAPGSDGAGDCEDEIRYSVDGGSTWYPYVSDNVLIIGSEDLIIEARRVCDGAGCDGSGTDFAELVRWSSLPVPTVAIDPIDYDICKDEDVDIAATISGGTTPYVIDWTGSGAGYLSSTTVADPTFNSPDFGSFVLNISVTDNNNCVASDEITVHVRDEVRPTITCPGDIRIELAPSECEILVDFAADINPDDNCDGVVYKYVAGSLESGDIFPIGIHTVSIYAEDVAGNLSDTCSFTVTIVDYINPNLGCKPINYSLDQNCEGVLTPTEVLVGWETGGIPDLGCPGSFTIEITGPNGESLGNHITGEFLGKTLGYTISHLSRFKCWNTILVEDKMPPIIECRDTSVHCLTDLTKLDMYRVYDNCGAVGVKIDEKIIDLPCDDDYVCKIERTYKAVDNYGNESAPCTSTIYLLRPSKDGIQAPGNPDPLECSDNYKKDANGHPHPDITGIPTYDGRKLWPQSELDLIYCNSIIDYKDKVLLSSSCKTIIQRTWRITEWHCSSAVELLVAVQTIMIIDSKPPVIPQLDDVVVTTRALSCSSIVHFPTLDITDNCNEVTKVIINVTTDGVASGSVTGNGGSLELGVGEHIITYTAVDYCKNIGEMSYKVTVRDQTDPVAICDQYATVSLREDGLTFVTADAIDDGSFDACGDVTLKIRRMTDPCGLGQDEGWHDRLEICCADANQSPMIVLLVTDKGGNTNMCMVSLNVQDKIQPRISCPDDLEIENCEFTFDPSLAGANHAFGEATITDNCPSNLDITHELIDNRSQCGTGEVVRTIGVNLNGKLVQTCTQTITFKNNDPFYINESDDNDPNDDVIWPKDYVALGQCSFLGLAPESLPDSSAFPILTEDACDMVGKLYTDQVLEFTQNGACYKILRTWSIIDWCQANKEWTYVQEIKVMDNDAPQFVDLPTTKLTFETATCDSREITLVANAVDCTPANELVWTYIIKKDGVNYVSGNGNSVTRIFTVGAYSIEFKVSDRCGNLSQGSYEFEVITTKPAVPVCIFGLSSNITMMDTDGDGIGDTPQTMVRPELFDNKSYHLCGYDFVLSFSADVTDRLRTYTCDDLGEQVIQLWVTDSHGNTAFCSTTIDIQDNDELCPPTGPLVSNVSGRIVKEDNKAIEEVGVELIGVESDFTETNREGQYAFGRVKNAGNYNIIPSKNGDDMNGVSTYDLVLIQRHILDIEPLKSPYKLIAADINNNGSITASDLSELRKLILGIYDEFPNNSSWRFVDASYKFKDAQDPWAEYVPELYEISNLRNNMDINFIGIKVGDVNIDAQGSKFDETKVASRAINNLAIGDRSVVKGDWLNIPVVATNSGVLYGLQAQLATSGLKVHGIKGASMKVADADFAIVDDNQVRLALAAGQGVHVVAGQTLFEIEVEATQSGKLSHMLDLGTDMLAEIYSDDQTIGALGIQWRNGETAQTELASVTPNPWSTHTEIGFELPVDGMVTFKVKDYTGKKWISTVDYYPSGQNVIKLSRADLPQSGVYFYEIRTENQILTGKMIVIE
ncbi:MAG: HYR domain-containing protein [Chitinophagales bacterium]|nr:HYR domain-containing protein [Chitinophagales bacterium]